MSDFDGLRGEDFGRISRTRIFDERDLYIFRHGDLYIFRHRGFESGLTPGSIL